MPSDLSPRTRKIAMFLILGATILTTGSVPSGRTLIRRFLAVTHSDSQRQLITIVTNGHTVSYQEVLAAGTRVRLVGTKRGHTISANRIDIIE